MEPEILETLKAIERILRELIHQVLPGTSDPKALILAKECVKIRKNLRVLEAQALTTKVFPND